MFACLFIRPFILSGSPYQPVFNLAYLWFQNQKRFVLQPPITSRGRVSSPRDCLWPVTATPHVTTSVPSVVSLGAGGSLASRSPAAQRDVRADVQPPAHNAAAQSTDTLEASGKGATTEAVSGKGEVAASPTKVGLFWLCVVKTVRWLFGLWVVWISYER